MLGFLTLLLCCQLAGEFIVVATHLPLPGPVVGMLLLFVSLLIKGSVPAGLQTVSQELLRHLSLLFVPAGVGVMLHVALIRDEWLAISSSLVASTAITIAVTGAAMIGIHRLVDRKAGARTDPKSD